KEDLLGALVTPRWFRLPLGKQVVYPILVNPSCRQIFVKKMMTYYTKEQRLEHVKQQSESGMTIRAYCERHSVKYHTFMNWRKKYQNLVSGSKKGDLNHNFIEVVSPRAHAGMGGIYIYFPNGIQIHLDQELDSRLLKLLSDG